MMGSAGSLPRLRVDWREVTGEGGAVTEAEWLACNDPQKMLEFLCNSASERKLRLFACGCCRRIWNLLVKPRSHEVVDVAERWADRQVTKAQRAEARRLAADVIRRPTDVRTWGAQQWAANAATCVASLAIGDYLRCTLYRVDQALSFEEEAAGNEKECRVALLRCVFGNPFRPWPALPASVLKWNDSTVMRLVQGIYSERAFDHLPILADALLDAGCEDEELIQHCRSGDRTSGGVGRSTCCWARDESRGRNRFRPLPPGGQVRAGPGRAVVERKRAPVSGRKPGLFVGYALFATSELRKSMTAWALRCSR